MTTRKILAMIIALVMSVSLCACAEGTADRGGTSTKSDDTATTSAKSDDTKIVSSYKKNDGRTTLYENHNGGGYSSYYITTSSKGTYFLFYTYYETEYVDFLESLDKDKYEIINISVQSPTIEYNSSYFQSTSYNVYKITYTKKSNEAQQN